GGGPRMAIRAAAEQPGAEAQAPHVGGHHRRHRLDGRAERLIEDPDPEELVYEPRRSGQEEEKTVRAGRARTHAGRASPARDPPPPRSRRLAPPAPSRRPASAAPRRRRSPR